MIDNIDMSELIQKKGKVLIYKAEYSVGLIKYDDNELARFYGDLLALDNIKDLNKGDSVMIWLESDFFWRNDKSVIPAVQKISKIERKEKTCRK